MQRLCYGLDDSGFEFQHEQEILLLFKTPRPTQVTTQSPTKSVPGIFLDGKAAEV
jgi:hypothetical protein